MYAAIDALADKLDRQVLKHKEKLVRRTAHDARGDQARRWPRPDAAAAERADVPRRIISAAPSRRAVTA